MPQEVFNPTLQRSRGRRTARTASPHVEIDDSLLETAIDDIASVVGDGRAYAGVEKFTDLRHDIGVLWVVEGLETTSSVSMKRRVVTR